MRQGLTDFVLPSRNCVILDLNLRVAVIRNWPIRELRLTRWIIFFIIGVHATVTLGWSKLVNVNLHIYLVSPFVCVVGNCSNRHLFVLYFIQYICFSWAFIQLIGKPSTLVLFSGFWYCLVVVSIGEWEQSTHLAPFLFLPCWDRTTVSLSLAELPAVESHVDHVDKFVGGYYSNPVPSSL